MRRHPRMDRRRASADAPGHPQPLSPADETHLLAVLPAALTPVVTLALQTGLRLSELRAQAWQDVDVAAGVLRVTHPKLGTARSISLTPEAVAVLAALPRDSPWLFEADVRTAAQQAGLRQGTWHSLRLTYLVRACHRPTA